MSLSAQVCMEANNNELKADAGECHEEAVLVKLLNEDNSAFTSHAQLQAHVESEEEASHIYDTCPKSPESIQTESTFPPDKSVLVP